MTVNPSTPPPSPGDSLLPPSAPSKGGVLEEAVPGARAALILLLLINLFNYIDRQVLAAVEPQIRASFFTDPVAVASVVGQTVSPLPGAPFLTACTLTEERLDRPPSRVWFFVIGAKTWMGILSTAFLVTYMLTSPIFGWLANRMSRWLLVGIGVIIWSLASGASGLAPLYGVMLLTRCFVGIGEAVYGPVAPTMISDLYPARKRGQVLAWFYAAIPFGGALGYALGAEVEKAAGDWRHAFYYVVPPGILLGLLCLFMKEPARGGTDQVSLAPRRREKLSDYLVLLRTPSYVFNTLGMTAMCFAMGGLAFWVPGYLKFRGVESLFGTDPRTAFGALTALAGLVSTLLGGLAGDALRGRFPGSYFLVSGTAMLLAFPLLLLMIALPFPLAWLPLVGFVFCLFFNTGPTNTILANVTHPLMRAPGFALNILIIHLFGDAISPPVMGAIADASNLDRAFQFVSFTVLLGGILWLLGSRYLERDTALAPTRLPE